VWRSSKKTGNSLKFSHVKSKLLKKISKGRHYKIVEKKTKNSECFAFILRICIRLICCCCGKRYKTGKKLKLMNTGKSTDIFQKHQIDTTKMNNKMFYSQAETSIS